MRSENEIAAAVGVDLDGANMPGLTGHNLGELVERNNYGT